MWENCQNIANCKKGCSLVGNLVDIKWLQRCYFIATTVFFGNHWFYNFSSKGHIPFYSLGEFPFVYFIFRSGICQSFLLGSCQLIRYSSTTTSLYHHAWIYMVPRNVRGGFCWQVFMFHVYLLYMNVEPCNYSIYYHEAMHVEHAAPVETHIIGE